MDRAGMEEQGWVSPGDTEVEVAEAQPDLEVSSAVFYGFVAEEKECLDLRQRSECH